MKKLYLRFLSLLLIISIAITTQAQVIITATAGTTGPLGYSTVKDAIDAVNAGTHRGTITVTINANTTETSGIVLNGTGIGAANYSALTIKPAAGSSPVVSASVSNGPLLKLSGADHITIDGSNNGTASRNLTFINTSITSPNVLVIGSAGSGNTASNVTVKNTILENGSASSTALILGEASVVGNPGYFENISIVNNDIRKAYIGVYAYAVASALNNNLLISGNLLNRTGIAAIRLVGIYVQGVDGATISDNILANFSTSEAEFDRAIWLATGTKNTTITGNTIENLSYTGTSSYAPIGINISPGIANSNIAVSNNTIRNIQSGGSGNSMGIYVYSALSGVTIDKNRISNIRNTNTSGAGSVGILLAPTIVSSIRVRNNFISDIASFGFDGYDFSDNGNGIVVDGGGGIDIDFNTVVLNTDQALTGAHRASCLLITGNVTSTGTVNVRNNIFANLQTIGDGNSRFAICNLVSNAVFGTIDHNDYYSASGNLSSQGTNASITTTLAALQSAIGQNASSLNQQPVFVAIGDLHLQEYNNVLLDDKGTPISGISTDFDGDARSGSTPDIGADEFTALPCTALTFATQPHNAVACLGTDTSFTVVASNAGAYQWQVNTGSGFNDISGDPSYGGENSATLQLYGVPPELNGFSYRCLVTNTDGCNSDYSATVTLTVNNNPIASVSPVSPAPICSGSFVTLTAPAGYTYEWRLDGNPISLAINDTYDATDAGNYSVLVTDATTGCSELSDEETVTVLPVVNGVENISICANELPYSWNGITVTAGGAAAATFTMPSVISGCDSTTTLNLTIRPNPVATATPGTETICSGDITNITLSSSVALTTYNWTVVESGVTGASNGNGSTITQSLTVTGVAAGSATYSVTPTADGCTGSAVSAIITVNTAATITCPSDITIDNAAGTCSAVATYTPAITGSPAPSLTYTFSGATTGSGSGTGSGSAFNVGQTTVTITATSSCGTTSCSFHVTVNDTEAPVITCPAPVNVSCSDAVPSPNAAAITAADNCSGVTVVHVGDVISNQSCANQYTVTRTYRATDASGNSADCTQTITVNDQIAPVISCPGNISVTTVAGTCSAIVNFNPTATDNCNGPVTIVSSINPGSLFAVGTTTVTVTATDACGNSSTCSFTVTVTDSQIPSVTSQPQDKIVCSGETASFNVVAADAVTYQWQQWTGSAWNNINGANDASFTTAATTPSMNGSKYRVVLQGKCTAINSEEITLTVNATPAPVINIDNTLCLEQKNIQLTGSPGGGVFSGAAINGNVWDLQSLTAGRQTINYTITAANGCSATVSKDIMLELCGDRQSVMVMQGYPNPTYGKATIKALIGWAANNWTIEVSTITGRVLERRTVSWQPGWNQFEVDLTKRFPGIYIVSLARNGIHKGAIKIVRQQ